LTSRLFVAKPEEIKPDSPAGRANVAGDYPEMSICELRFCILHSAFIILH